MAGPPPSRDGVPADALVVGLAVAGAATARQLLARGHTVRVCDDRPSAAACDAASALVATTWRGWWRPSAWWCRARASPSTTR
jgi:glycine/D-amino acid oxidase-like deaminating enzyme